MNVPDRDPKRQRVSLLSPWVPLALIAMIGLSCADSPPTLRSVRRSLHAGEFTKPKEAPQGALINQDGQLFDLGKELEGRLAFVFFGYTSCPDICPLSMATLSRALDQLGPEERARVSPVFISLDPQRDTPEKIKSWISGFGDDFVGLTGTEAALEVVLSQFGYVQPHHAYPTEGPYEVAHPSDIFAITPDGFVRFGYLHNSPPDQIAEDIQALLSIEWAS